MREIKFRGKRLDNGEWVYGFLIQYENGWFICNFIGDAYQYEVDPSTVGQFTGLKDKNGKEIYEGDIVRAWSEGYCGTFEIRWREDGGGSPMFILYPAWQNREMWFLCSAREEDGKCYDRGLEVIGNIHENKELLQN